MDNKCNLRSSVHKPKYPSSTPWKIEWQRLIVYVKVDCFNPIPHLRTIAVRKDSGRLLAPLQKCYDYICEILKTKQLGLEHLFWLQDPDLFLVFARPVVANYHNIELGQLVFGTGHIFWIHVPYVRIRQGFVMKGWGAATREGHTRTSGCVLVAYAEMASVFFTANPTGPILLHFSC